MDPIARQLALAYIKNKNKEKTLQSMILICFLAILVGTFALTLVTCIMSGFEKATLEKVRSIHPQIIMRSPDGFLNVAKIKQIIDIEFPDIRAISPSTEKQLLIHNPLNNETTAVVAKAIDPIMEQQMGTISKKIIASNNQTLQYNLKANHVIIGKKLAQQLKLSPGSTIEIWYSDLHAENMSVNKTKAVVSSFFDVGIEEFDAGLIICSLSFLQTLFPQEGICQINIELGQTSNESHIIQSLQQRFKLHVYSWKSLYPALVSALKLEKYAMVFILALITLVASMNILSLLFMYIIYKQQDIALLITVGLPHKSIKKIFIYIGMLISLCATIIGIIMAFIIALLIKTFPFITLPDTYYVTHLPVSLDLFNFILVFFITMIITFLASVWASKKINTINVVTVLKGDT